MSCNYDYPNEGAWGNTVQQQLSTNAKLNASFSSHAWEDAKQNGCLTAPCGSSASLPSWPPPPKNGFIYPAQDKQKQTVQGQDIEAHYGEPFDPSAPLLEETETEPNYCASVTSGVGYDVAKKMAESMVQEAQMTQQPVCPEREGAAEAASPSATSSCRLKSEDFTPKSIPSCMVNTVKGIIYDFQHWKQLPKDSFFGKLGYAFGRDDRPFYLGIWLVLFIFFIVILMLLFGKKKSPKVMVGGASYPQHIPLA